MIDQDLRELLAKATPVRDGWKLRVKDDGEERYELIGDPCGFPVATFGDASDAEFDLAARQLLPTLLARLEAAEAGWRGIESAPKDGARVIVARWGWVHRDIESVKRAVGGEEVEKIWHLCFATTAFYLADKGYWTDGLERLVEPTHFILIPSPPSAEAEKGGGE